MPPEPASPPSKALAHPLRVRLLMELRTGPATSAMLARRTMQTRGNVSYHLRTLARARMIEDELDEGTERERWWRLTALPEIDPHALTGSAGVDEAAAAMMSERSRRLTSFAARLRVGDIAAERVAATRVSELRLLLSAAQQAELVVEIDAVLARWEQVPSGPGAGHVEVQLAIFSGASDD